MTVKINDLVLRNFTKIYVWMTLQFIRQKEVFSPNEMINKKYFVIWNAYWRKNATEIDSCIANSPGDLGSIPGRVIPKTQKMVLDASLLNTQHYKVGIKGKVRAIQGRSSALPYTLV